MASHLLRSLAYLGIRHNGSALPWVNWGLPATISIAMVLAVGHLAPGVNVFHAGGVIDRLLSFVQSLPGFYLAALAAVATFNRPDLDAPMAGNPPQAKILNAQGNLQQIALTRRRFLCMMFSYLTALSFAITVAAIAGLAVADSLAQFVGPQLTSALRPFGAFLYLLLVTQMLVVTLWGLYYLGERMHTPGA
jgi:hypothetical protein